MEAAGQALLIDAGLSAREVLRRAALAGLDHHRLKAVLVTHEHRDHILGIGPLARRLNLPVYINQRTLAKARPVLGRIQPCLFQDGETFAVGELRLRAFSLSHDAADPMGLVVENGGAGLGLATDLGKATGLVRDRLAGCRTLIVEANHDPQMLWDGPYPWEIKQRVRGLQGHLSNEDAAGLLEELVHPGLSQVILAHLSQVNNRPELALEAVGPVLSSGGKSVRLEAARQDSPSAVFEL